MCLEQTYKVLQHEDTGIKWFWSYSYINYTPVEKQNLG